MPARRAILLIALSLFTMGAVYFGLHWSVYGRFIQKTDDAYVRADTVAISAKTPGRIASVLVAENTRVSAGDPLMRIEDNDYAALVRQAEADRAARQAAIDTIDHQISLNQANIADAKAKVESTQADLKLRRTEYNRAAELAKQNFASRQTLDQRENALKAAEAHLASAKAALAAAEASSAVLVAQRQQAEAALAASKASLDIAEINLQNTVIRAPKDGVVGNLKAREGEYAATGRELMSLVPVQNAYIVANFKETQVKRFRIGESVSIDIDAYPDADIKGVIESLAPASGAEFSLLPPENATGNFTKVVQRVPVRIKIVKAPPGVDLLPGLSVTASIDTRTAPKEAAIFVPRSEGEPVALAGKP